MRDIPGYEGKYAVTSCGKVWSHLRKRFLSSCGAEDTYQTVCLWVNGKEKLEYVHRLVAKTYVPNPDPEKYKLVNHKDEIKSHNWANNLEWCDYKYNNNYGAAVTKRSTPVLCIELNKVFRSASAAAKELNCYPANVWGCCRGELKSTGGYHFKYV